MIQALRSRYLIAAIALTLICSGNHLPVSAQSTSPEWCSNQTNLSPSARHTVDAILEAAATSDCQQLTNLTTLDLTNNQITNITPLRSLTNLTILFLDDNPIVDRTCPISPASVCQF